MSDFFDLIVEHYNPTSESWEYVTITGVISIKVKHRLNAPSECQIVLSNVKGKRAFTISRGDRVTVKATPNKWISGSVTKPFVFCGIVSDIETSNSTYSVLVYDTMGLLSNEIMLSNPLSISTLSDGASVLKEIVSGSSYNLLTSLEKMLGETRIIIPSNLNLKGKTRLSGMQSVLSLINATPNLFRLSSSLSERRVEFNRLPSLDDTTYTPYIAGRLPRTTAPLDIIPTSIIREEDDSDLINVVSVQNSDLDILVTEPATLPASPIQRLFEESMIADEVSARLFARQILNQQGVDKSRWIVEAIPNRLDIIAGDIIEFKSVEGGLAGKHMVFDVTWNMTTDGCDMTLTVGRQAPDFITSIRFAAGQSI
jgi:hypothetical protein